MVLYQADIHIISLLEIKARFLLCTTLNLLLFKGYKGSLIIQKAEEAESKYSQALKSPLWRNTTELTNLFRAQEHLFNNAAQLILAILNLNNLTRETNTFNLHDLGFFFISPREFALLTAK